MSHDTNCPYCQAEIEINHDDGYGYGDDQYQQTCRSCGKAFVFTTTTVHYYDVEKADCLNGGEHKWKRTCTIPREFERMRCEMCGEEKLIPDFSNDQGVARR